MSRGPGWDLCEILLLLKKSNLGMSVQYYALNFLMLVKVCLFFFLICLALLQESSCICAKSNC